MIYQTTRYPAGPIEGIYSKLPFRDPNALDIKLEGEKFRVKAAATPAPALTVVADRAETVEDYTELPLGSRVGWGGSYMEKAESNLWVSKNGTYTETNRGLVGSRKVLRRGWPAAPTAFQDLCRKPSLRRRSPSRAREMDLMWPNGCSHAMRRSCHSYMGRVFVCRKRWR